MDIQVMLKWGNKNTNAKTTFQDPVLYNFQINTFHIVVEHPGMNKNKRK